MTITEIRLFNALVYVRTSIRALLDNPQNEALLSALQAFTEDPIAGRTPSYTKIDYVYSLDKIKAITKRLPEATVLMDKVKRNWEGLTPTQQDEILDKLRNQKYE